MIGLLLALYPRRWRREYGAEYRALLEDTPLTRAVVLDVVRTAGRLRLAARPVLIPVLAALVLSAAGEVIAVHGRLTDNILWIPSSPLKAIVLAAVLLPWLLAATAVHRSRQETRR